MHTHEPIHMHSQQVICCQNQHLKRYINLRLTSAWSCSSCHQCQVCGEPAARRVTVRMIKGAIRTLVILQITASWARKKKKVTFRLALSLHPSICALSRKKKTHMNHLRIQKHLCSAFVFGKACIKVQFYLPDSFVNKTAVTCSKMLIDGPKFETLK